MDKQIDNSGLAAKLELRRHFLAKYHADNPPHVLDCCQGGGVIWERLRQEFKTASYWGVDTKRKKGRVKLDSVRILAQPGWPQNVVDIDTYGSPWKHWGAMLPNVRGPLTVFLTLGAGRHQQTVLDKFTLTRLGLGGLYDRLPKTLKSLYVFRDIHLSACLTRACDFGIILEEVQAASAGDTQYVGCRLVPKANGREAATPGRSEHPEPVKEVRNV
ncbi:MAG: hypothetical protein HQ582_09170 [Planctomycetes bacterium]|nr:hypothetical protein [Planctomycetota bacterium]